MQKMQGTLVVKIIKGIRGPFAVGDLNTSIGKFRVKAAFLEQFKEGSYDGDFLVTRIYPHTYTHNNRTVTECAAEVAEVFLKTVEERELPSEPDEPDPIDLDQAQVAKAPLVNPAPHNVTTPPPLPISFVSVGSSGKAKTTAIPAALLPEVKAAIGVAATADDLDDAALFGDELYALVITKVSVKMDVTVDRALLRKQCDRLKALGYRFDFKQQNWNIA